MLEVTGRGLFPSINVVCHPIAGGEEEEAILDPTCTVGRAPLVGFWINMAVVVGVRGVLGVSLSLL